MTEAKEEPFEKTLQKLEALLQKLEKPEIPLEDALSTYEAGVSLVKQAQAKLDVMDARLEQLMKDGSTAPMAAPKKSSDDDGKSR